MCYNTYHVRVLKHTNKGGGKMKLKIGEKVYLQKYEVAFMMHELNYIHSSVYDELFAQQGFFSISGTNDSYDFACSFEDPESVEWLMTQDWIVDYEKYAKLSVSELISVIENIGKEYSNSLAKFDNEDEEYKESHLSEAREEFKKYDHMLGSLADLLSAKNGKLKFKFPNTHGEKSTFNIFRRLFCRSAQ